MSKIPYLQPTSEKLQAHSNVFTFTALPLHHQGRTTHQFNTHICSLCHCCSTADVGSAALPT
eukprot:1142642-Pelagomonas_calceolata.AAC.19